MIFKEKYQQEDLREFKIEDSRFNINFGYRPNGEFRIKIARRHESVLDYTSDEFFTSKKRGQPFGRVSDDFKILITEDTSILKCNLSSRTLNLLNKYHKILGLKKIDSEFKLSDLKFLDLDEFMKCRGAGKRSKNELRNILVLTKLK